MTARSDVFFITDKTKLLKSALGQKRRSAVGRTLPVFPTIRTNLVPVGMSQTCQQATFENARRSRSGVATAQRGGHQRRLLRAAAPLSHRRSFCLLHCDRHTAHGGRNFSADPGTTEL